MKLYNQLSKKVETFKPLDPENVKIYTCGPTVYSYAHIGNFFSYIYWDLLVRVIKLNGWTPNRVLNVTDVGHLASDADDGEDKLEKGAKREGKTVYETDKTRSFLSDMISADLKRRGMKFVGTTIIYSYLQAIGVIYSHDKSCMLYRRE